MPADRAESFVREVVLVLKKNRLERDISINKLSWLSGVSPKGIAFIEDGKNSPTLRNVIRLADALEMPLVELIGDAEKAWEIRNGD